MELNPELSPEQSAAIARELNDLTTSLLREANLLEQYPLEPARRILERLAPAADSPAMAVHKVSMELLEKAIAFRDVKVKLVRLVRERASSIVRP